MFSLADNKFMRNDYIDVSNFARDNMQYVVQSGHFETVNLNIARHSYCEKDTYLVFYLIKGNGILIQNDEYTAIETHTTLLLNCDNEYSLFLDHCEAYYALIQGNRISDYIKNNRIIFDLRFSKKTEIFFYSVFSCIDKYAIIDEFSISAAVLRFYSAIHIHLNEFKTHTDKQEVIQRAVSFIENNYAKDITVVDISKAIGYSEYYFIRMFREVMMMTPYEYLKRKRLSQVKILLLSTTKTIEEIALECGYHTDISLYKTFKNTYSITPRDYKKSVGK